MCARHEESPENVVFSGLWCGKQDLNRSRSFNFDQKHNMQYNDEMVKYNILRLHVPK